MIQHITIFGGPIFTKNVNCNASQPPWGIVRVTMNKALLPHFTPRVIPAPANDWGQCAA